MHRNRLTKEREKPYLMTLEWSEAKYLFSPGVRPASRICPRCGSCRDRKHRAACNADGPRPPGWTAGERNGNSRCCRLVGNPAIPDGQTHYLQINMKYINNFSPIGLTDKLQQGKDYLAISRPWICCHKFCHHLWQYPLTSIVRTQYKTQSEMITEFSFIVNYPFKLAAQQSIYIRTWIHCKKLNFTVFFTEFLCICMQLQ